MAQAYEGIGNLDRAVAAWSATVRNASGSYWNYWSRYARALARTGYTEAALAAADSALTHTPAADKFARELVVQLRDEIRAGCFGTRVASVVSACEDPIGQWKLLAPIMIDTSKNAKQSQNATTTGSNPSSPDTGSADSTIQESTG
jgi:hypothetical protein